MYIKGQKSNLHHAKTYGMDFEYRHFIEQFKPERFNADEWAEIFKKSGAKYIMPVGEHHDGVKMYASDLNPWNMQKLNGRDYMAELHNACDNVGLGYLKLGQPSTTLSGGEAQRIKLATELSKRSTGKTIYVLDEPTTGLHFADVHKLVEILHRLTDEGNTVVVIEHNLDVIKVADYIIDMGPDGGDRGGTVVVAGTPEQVAEHPTSYTGKYVKQMLERQ